VLQETPPATATGVQPVPMGMLSAEMSMPSRPVSRPSVTESSELEFLTFWQHWAPPVGAGGVQVRLVLTVTGTQLMPTSETKSVRRSACAGHRTTKHSLWSTWPHCTVFVLHDTPPRTETGVQPVPMGMLNAEMSMPSRPLIIPLVTESTELEFSTSLQH
jgi:hypothetical protein